MKTLKISCKDIIIDIASVLFPAIPICLLPLTGIVNIGVGGNIAVLITMGGLLCYNYYTLVKCYRFDRHTRITISGDNICYVNKAINMDAKITDISEYIICTSSRIGHHYFAIKLKNGKCMFLTDLIDTKDIYNSCKSLGIKIEYESDVFLTGLPN